MVIEIAVGVVAVAAVVLVAFLVPVLIRLRKRAEESERLLRQMNEDLPVLLKEATQAAINMNQVVTEVLGGAACARVLREAMVGMGVTNNHVNGTVAGGSVGLLTNLNRHR